MVLHLLHCAQNELSTETPISTSFMRKDKTIILYLLRTGQGCHHLDALVAHALSA